MKKIAALVATCATMTMAAAANAAPTITYTNLPDGSFSAYFGDTPQATSFDDLFAPFIVSTSGLLTATLSTSGITKAMDLDFSLAEILGPGGVTVPFNIVTSPLSTPAGFNPAITNPDGLEQGSIGGVVIGPGTYTLRVSGTTSGAKSVASLAGTVNFVPSAVPEPAAWALMILGFGVIGSALRRQRAGRQQIRFAYS